MKGIIAKIVAMLSGDLVQKVMKCLPQIVAEAEKAMADGVISSTERKAIAMEAVNIVAQEFGLKVNGITKWVISVMIDSIAKKLPSKDIKVPDLILRISKEW